MSILAKTDYFPTPLLTDLLAPIRVNALFGQLEGGDTVARPDASPIRYTAGSVISSMRSRGRVFFTQTCRSPLIGVAGASRHHEASLPRRAWTCYIRIVSSGLWDWSNETAFYVSNTMLTAVNAADAIPDHWKIETTSHYSRDVTFGEDKSRIRTDPRVFARLRSFAFSILKSNKTSTLCQDRYRAALAGIDNLLEVLAIP